MARTKCSGVSQRPNKQGDSSENMLDDDGGDSGYDGDGDGDGDGLYVRRKSRGRRRTVKVKGKMKSREGGNVGGDVGSRGVEVVDRNGSRGEGRDEDGNNKKTVCAVLMRYLGFSMRREGWVRR